MSATGLLERLVPQLPSEPSEASAWRWLALNGLPTPREEAWRYTPVNDIARALEDAVPAPARQLDRSIVDQLVGRHGGPRAVMVNGRYDPALSDTESLPAGLSFGPSPGHRLSSGPVSLEPDDPVDGFDALNRAMGAEVVSVAIEPDALLDVPVHVVHIAAPVEGFGVCSPRTAVRVGAGARLHLIETYTSLRGAGLVNAQTSVQIAKGATVDHHRVQDECSTAMHVGRTAVDLAERARFRSTSVMLGGSVARQAIDVRMTGAGALADLDGMNMGYGDQRHDTVVCVEHAASSGTSSQRFMGIVDDHARASFSGRIIVRAGTVGNDATQSNRNLVLSEHAQADTRPWLEIFADDVSCSHGATVGRLDEDALFYLRSRGIPLDLGRSMLIEAFARQVTETLEPVSLREHVDAAMARRAKETGR